MSIWNEEYGVYSEMMKSLYEKDMENIRRLEQAIMDVLEDPLIAPCPYCGEELRLPIRNLGPRLETEVADEVTNNGYPEKRVFQVGDTLPYSIPDGSYLAHPLEVCMKCHTMELFQTTYIKIEGGRFQGFSKSPG